MKVKMKSLSIGPGGRRLPGEIYEVEDKEAREMIDKGYAEEVVDEVKEEVTAPDDNEKPQPSKSTKKKSVKK